MKKTLGQQIANANNHCPFIPSCCGETCIWCETAKSLSTLAARTSRSPAPDASAVEKLIEAVEEFSDDVLGVWSGNDDEFPHEKLAEVNAALAAVKASKGDSDAT